MTGSDSSVVFSQPVTGFASIAFGYPNAFWGEPQTPGIQPPIEYRKEVRKLNQKQYAAFAANAKTLDSLRRNEVNYVPGVFEVTKVIVLGKEDFEKLSEDVSPGISFPQG